MDNNRYSRQVLLREFGPGGQDKLFKSRVLVIGAGGLGCPILQYLAGAGVGTLGIADDDQVAVHNLHRQVLYSMEDIGKPKVERAALALHRLNPEINILTYGERITTENAVRILSHFDIVIDGTDNFPSRYLINDACVLLNKPLVYGAISKFEGQLGVFNCKQGGKISSNYRDLFPSSPLEDEVLNCAEAGVLGILPGIIGMMMASETIKLITGLGDPLVNRILTYNALNNQSFAWGLPPNPATRSAIPVDINAFEKMDYPKTCSSSNEYDLDFDSFNALIGRENVAFVDVRNRNEKPSIYEFPCVNIPMEELSSGLGELAQVTIVLFCQSGKRSRQAANLLVDKFGNTKKIYSLSGGILKWKEQASKQIV